MKRSPALVFLLGLCTLGLYLLFWYNRIYNELKELGGKTPTGNSYGFDLLLTIVTCGVWGIYVDYRISLTLDEIIVARSMPAQNSAPLVLVLDIFFYVTGGLTYLATSAIHQDIINRVYEQKA